MRRLDVIVVGAGAAGLAAARTLGEGGVRAIVLEARDRIGGRILTHRDPRVPVPLELGAEFIHGSAPETSAIVREAGLLAVDVPEHRFEHRGRKRLPSHDFWNHLDHVMRRMSAGRKPDRSLDEFLATAPGGATAARDRALTREFVENFHAADALRVSERALAKGGSPKGDVVEQRMGRLVGGYDQVVEWLARDVDVKLRRVVRDITWSPGAVEVRCERVRFAARAVVVTVPVGVLQARAGDEGAIRFHPLVPRYEAALARIGMGAVTRMVLLFKRAFWGEGKLAGLSFLQGHDPDFPVWWTQAPARVPVLVGWAGGRNGARLSLLDERERRARVLASAARQFGVPAKRAQELFVEAWTHDWQRDPYARGAYSYPLVGGDAAGATLARPERGTLYLAGEATVDEANSGTVHGAIHSGRAAARKILRSLRGR